MEDNGISYKELISEFDEIFQKAKNLKIKLETEIEKINSTYKNIENEIILSFKKQHIELEEKEKNLKLELNSRVKQIKDELEKNLTISNNILLSCEKTNEIISKCEIKINNDIKTLYYISEINKSKEKAKEFINKKIKNYDISFESDKYVLYNDYYFNGIPFIKNIKAEKRERKLYISWDLDNSNIKDINTDNIKYSLSIRIVGSLIDYRCETSDKFYYYNYYDEKNDYEIKVRSSLDGYQSEWYEIKKSKEEIQPSSNIFANDNNNKLFNSISFGNKIGTGGLFGNISNDNKNSEKGIFGAKSIFSNSEIKDNNQENSIFKPLINNNDNKLFSTDNSKDTELFKNNNQNSGIFGNNDKGGLFGNSNNNDVKKVSTLFSLFGEKNEEKNNI